MDKIKFTNFALSQLATSLSTSDTSILVEAGHGARFPALTGGDFFYVTLESAALVREIVKVTARAGDTLTVVRGQDGTTAVAWPAGSPVALRLNAAALEYAMESASAFLPKSNPSYTGTLTGGTGVINIGSGQFYKDASGNVGIGTSSPLNRLHVIASSNNSVIRVSSSTAGEADWFAQSLTNAGVTGTVGNHPYAVYTNGAERARIDSSGNLLVGITSSQSGIAADPAGISLFGPPALGAGVFTRNGIPLYANNKNASGVLIQFYCNGNTVGDIASNGTTTSYNALSDYRLKHDIQPMTGALAKVAALKPVTYKWNIDDSESQGFIAHELQAVVPEAVTGEKDGVETYIDENGVEQTRPRYQGIDTSFLVATLTAAIQELKGINDAQAQIITALTARVEALEGAK